MKWLILLGGLFSALILQGVSLWKNCLLSRVLNVYRSRLDKKRLGLECLGFGRRNISSSAGYPSFSIADKREKTAILFGLPGRTGNPQNEYFKEN